MRTISGFMDGLFEQRNNTQALNGLNYLKIIFSSLILCGIPSHPEYEKRPEGPEE